MDKQIPINPTEEVGEKPLDTDLCMTVGETEAEEEGENFTCARVTELERKSWHPGCLVML